MVSQESGVEMALLSKISVNSAFHQGLYAPNHLESVARSGAEELF